LEDIRAQFAAAMFRSKGIPEHRMWAIEAAAEEERMSGELAMSGCSSVLQLGSKTNDSNLEQVTLDRI